ncbi:sucrose phosphorylase [Uliginosibacterium gangwonense]|uniref:sucrose phosphorylase n=1 Tax=Uliginosibacterium gangwonense TaxID=392736 RepID=UPI0003787647|nr:sucrose phosphorylase [Uliginosibacterium gangwonense]
MKNQVQLITYVDRLGGGGLAGLQSLLAGPLRDLFGGVHLLPFFTPIDGSDAGFDPIDHATVDPRLGDWTDVRQLGKDYEIMADLIVNHMSAQSAQFLDYSAKGGKSEYNGLFLRLSKVFPQGATEEDLLKIYRPRPGLPFTYTTLANGQKAILWTSFTSNQIDIDVTHASGQRYLTRILDAFAEAGIQSIRLDAAGYAIKKPGTNCFMIPETFAFIGELAAAARTRGMEVLVEIHSYYRKQIEIAQRVDRVYDFALPPLVLHALINKTGRYLKQWLAISPRNAITVLDTHDGIGVIDVGADAGSPNSPGLIPPEELSQLVEQMHANSANQSRRATGAAASNLDLYQVNCTYYDALGRNDRDYILARAIQFFSPGIPQVYYVGLLAGCNDMGLLEKTQVGRDINRHYYTPAEVAEHVERPVVKDLFRLIHFRNTHSAFGGTFSLPACPDTQFYARWTHEDAWAELQIDFANSRATILHNGDTGHAVFDLFQHLDMMQ